MVFFTRHLLRIKPDEIGRHLKKNFIDKLRIFVKSGNGGKGIKKLGGIGGDGGNIYLKANNNTTLKDVYVSNLKKRYIANNGEDSKKIKLYGENGQDLIITVPIGITAVTDSKVVIGELNNENEQLLIAKGGQGGSSLNNFNADQGTSFSVSLDLKLIADVGLIGFPNAGKSTLLSIISRARPKIASYPFTTLNPQLGIVEYDDKRKITVADIPGVLEGAHQNRGMGHKFLKHISRTKINLFIVDIDGFQLNHKFEKRTAFETVVFLNKELELYDENLIDKPAILAINKVDMDVSNEKTDELLQKLDEYEKSIESIEPEWRPKKRVYFNKILKISAKENVNIEDLCAELREIIDLESDKNRISKFNKQNNDTHKIEIMKNNNLI